MTKTSAGNFFEDFRLGQTIRHATPRTMTVGDVALYTGAVRRRALRCSPPTRSPRRSAIRDAPIDDLLVFHIVFGKTVPDISLNAVANLGYAELPVPQPGLSGRHADRDVGGDRAEGELQPQDRRGLCPHPRLQAGRHRGARIRALGDGATSATKAAPRPAITCRGCRPRSSRELLGAACPPLDVGAYDFALAGSPHRFGDYEAGEKIDHVDGITVEEAEHQTATRLYQNTARIHFDQFAAAQGRFGRRLVYGGHVISLARALSFNGLANAFHIAAINGGRHVAPLFAGVTVFAWSEVLATSELPGRSDVGALRLRTVATKDRPCPDFPLEGWRRSTIPPSSSTWITGR